MTRWIMKFEVEAHAGLKPDLPRLGFKHPNGDYEIYLKNVDVSPRTADPLLNAFVIFDAVHIDNGSVLGKRYLREFLDLLGFSTGARFLIKRAVAIFDWTPDTKMRKGQVYTRTSDPNIPHLFLDEGCVPTVETFARTVANEPLRRALRWFNVGVSSQLPDIQFQWFWFAIETLARNSLEKERVPDRCCRCRGSLYCPKCEEISTHRPYPTQQIETLFRRHISDAPERAFIAATAMRHALLHGENLESVEREHDITIEQLVNSVGELAWAVLFEAMSAKVEASDSGRRIFITQPARFSHYELAATAHVAVSLEEGLALDIDQFPGVDINFVVE